MVPGVAEIRALHERVAPSRGAFEQVWTHCEIVWRLAEPLVGSLDGALVRAGCLLHDIGVYRLAPDTHYLRHGVLGDDLLAEWGFPEPLRRFCSHHTGVGLTRDDVLSQGLPLPVADYLAESDEERLVMYADKFHSKRVPPVFVSAPTYAASVARFGPDKPAAFDALTARFGLPDLEPLSKEYGHLIV